LTYHRGLAALAFQGCSLQPAPVWNATFGIPPAGKDYDDRHSPPTVANGVVYISDGPGQILYAFDAGSGQPLWNSGATISNEVYTAPVVDKNVYATDFGTLYAFGLSGTNAAVRQLGAVHPMSQLKSHRAKQKKLFSLDQ
jgi:outer membrane protein assembly factor BamB